MKEPEGWEVEGYGYTEKESDGDRQNRENEIDRGRTKPAISLEEKGESVKEK